MLIKPLNYMRISSFILSQKHVPSLKKLKLGAHDLLLDRPHIFRWSNTIKLATG